MDCVSGTMMLDGSRLEHGDGTVQSARRGERRASQPETKLQERGQDTSHHRQVAILSGEATAYTVTTTLESARQSGEVAKAVVPKR